MVLSLKTNELPIVRFIGEIAYHQPWTHFVRQSNEYIIYIIKSGSLFIEEANHKYVLKKKDFFIFESGSSHKGFKSSCCDYFYIHFSHNNILTKKITNENDYIKELQMHRYRATTSNSLLGSLPDDSICYLPKHFSLNNLEYYSASLKESIDHYNIRQENYKEFVSTELLNMLIRISRDYVSSIIQDTTQRGNKPLSKAQDILRFINMEYSNKMTSKEISEKFEGNFDYLNRCFKQMSGYTIFNYLNIIRISKAKELIHTTNMKFSDIAYLVGIDNPYYFSRLFKKLVGTTPTEYYNKHFKTNS